MKLKGNYYKDGSWWLAEIPSIQYLEQGKTKSELFELVKSGIQLLMEDTPFKCTVEDQGEGEFILSSDNPRVMGCFIIKRLREAQGLSIREVAQKLGHKSHTEFARHESGKTAMTLETFNKYVQALSDKDIVILIA